MQGRMIILGLGYSGAAIAAEALRQGFAVQGTRRDPSLPGAADTDVTACAGLLAFDAAGPAIAAATHLVITASPAQGGDPVLATHAAALAAALAAAAGLRWVGYISTTGVYGDRAGGWVDEATPPAPLQDRTRARVAAEDAWASLADRVAVDIFRTGGIYGPGRSVFDELRAGTARRVIKPGHCFSRIHRADIGRAVVAAARQAAAPGRRVLHLVDDAPVESAAVVEDAAAMLGLPPPPAIPFAEALARMSPMARSFWAENRKVANAATRQALGIAWRYPNWREGLAGILAEGG